MTSPVERAQFKERARQTLGVGALASNKELRAAWKRKAFENHPDRRNGDDTQFQAVRSAYELLKDECDVDEGPQSDAQFRQSIRRAVVQTRIEDLSPKEETLLEALADERRARSTPVAEHVPVAVRRKGRKLTYIIRAAIEEGANRVAVPKAFRGRSKDEDTTVISFNSPKAGSGKIVLPQDIQESSFPNAQRIRIQFEGS